MKRIRVRNPYGNTSKRKAALAWLAARGITQPRAVHPTQQHVTLHAHTHPGRPRKLAAV